MLFRSTRALRGDYILAIISEDEAFAFVVGETFDIHLLSLHLVSGIACVNLLPHLAQTKHQ